jgi:hypothetical protein
MSTHSKPFQIFPAKTRNQSMLPTQNPERQASIMLGPPILFDSENCQGARRLFVSFQFHRCLENFLLVANSDEESSRADTCMIVVSATGPIAASNSVVRLSPENTLEKIAAGPDRGSKDNIWAAGKHLLATNEN